MIFSPWKMVNTITLILKLFGALTILTTCVKSANPPGCIYQQNLALNTPSYIWNLNYPNKYNASTDCYWYGYSPVGSKISLYCELIDIPLSSGCTGDQLRVSLNGDSTFYDSRVFCGAGTLDLVTTTNYIAIRLFATPTSTGGRIYCRVKARRTTTACDCGWKKSTRIVGGVPTGINEYPMTAGLVDRTISEVVCGGTIISNRYVVSAAHCLAAISSSNLIILVGDWNPNIGTDTSSAVIHQVQLPINVHPNYNQNLQTNDIMLIKTQTAIAFTLNVGPACLPFRYENTNFVGQWVTYLGWGQSGFGQPKTDELNKVDVPIISNDVCRTYYTDKQFYGQFCTFRKGYDACQGDSGGPALWMDQTTSKLHVLGIISAGYACAVKPGINTKVADYLDWIQNLSPEVTYCEK